MPPTLNWKSDTVASLENPRTSERGQRTVLHLRVPAERLGRLATEIQEVLSEEEREVRLELPREWLLFWKRREEESRLLLAHPEAEVWVATVALEAAHARALIACFGSAGRGDSITVGELGRVGEVSNLEVVISVV
ncbi:MAG: hypothetical protein NDJ90_08445 [Oligoflexia bacterium]|nr:hypothetical protein [Oligoflexia bacterium]